MLVFLKMICFYVGNPAPEIEWYLNGNLIIECSKWRMGFYDDGRCSLTVQDAQEEDQGKIKCVAFSELGKASCSASLYIEGIGSVIFPCPYVSRSMAGFTN